MKRILVFLLLLTSFPVVAGINDFAYQIPAYPQHGIPLTARLMGMGNIAPVGQQSSLAVISSPSTLAAGPVTDIGTFSLGYESSAGPFFQPGSVAYSFYKGGWGYGFAVAGQQISQGSPQFLYRDEYAASGAASNNMGFSDIQSNGGRNQLMFGVGYAVTDDFRVGLSMGLLFGALKKTATVTQYDDATFSTVLGTYTQTDLKQYSATVMSLSTSWDISRRWGLGLRLLTPVSNGATVQSTVRDGSNTIVYQDPAPYLIEDHVMGADAEFGLGLAYLWEDGDVSLFSFEYHDNVYFGSSASWENYELRFGHESRSGGKLWRYGGHVSIPFLDGGTRSLISGDDNGGAQSVGINFGGQVPWRKSYMDWALVLREEIFNSGGYTILQLSMSTPI